MPWLGSFGWLSNSGGAGETAYWQKASAIQAANLIGYWRLNETTGTAATDVSIQANNAAYSGVTLANAAGPDGVLCPYFDGAASYVDCLSAGMQADFSGAAGTLALWCKVNAAAIWTDGAQHTAASVIRDGNNSIMIAKMATNNYLRQMYFTAGANFSNVDKNDASTTAWFHLALSWDAAADEVRGYYNGVQVGTTKTAIGVFLAGNISPFRLGTTSTTLFWNGWLSNAGIWKVALTPAQVLALATV